MSLQSNMELFHEKSSCQVGTIVEKGFLWIKMYYNINHINVYFLCIEAPLWQHSAIPIPRSNQGVHQDMPGLAGIPSLEKIIKHLVAK